MGQWVSWLPVCHDDVDMLSAVAKHACAYLCSMHKSAEICKQSENRPTELSEDGRPRMRSDGHGMHMLCHNQAVLSQCSDLLIDEGCRLVVLGSFLLCCPLQQRGNQGTGADSASRCL